MSASEIGGVPYKSYLSSKSIWSWRLAANPGNALGKALETAVTAAADQTFREVIRTAIGKRDLISGWISRAGRPPSEPAHTARPFSTSACDSVSSAV